MQKPTNGELEILRLLWQDSPATVRQINDRLNARLGVDQKKIGYTTTLKLMQIMHDKKEMLSRIREGKTHLYSPKISESDTQQVLVDRLLETAFQGSAMKLVMKALGSSKSSPKELDEIRRYLDQMADPNSSDQS
ncbi:MAG: BlaI/MecI/CopY family transcriptional regulator [Bacteroidota bacterium]